MPRELANPVQKPVAATVALDSIEIRVSRTPKMGVNKISVQGGIRLYSDAGVALERVGVEFSLDDLSDDEAAALQGCLDVLEGHALGVADKKGLLPGAETVDAKSRASALK